MWSAERCRFDPAATADTVRIKRIAGVVPSRAADNLFWLGRYLERAEATLRLIRALGTSMRDTEKGGPAALHSVERIQRILVTWGATSQSTRANPARVIARLQSEEVCSALSLVVGGGPATSRVSGCRPMLQIITEMVERLVAGRG